MVNIISHNYILLARNNDTIACKKKEILRVPAQNTAYLEGKEQSLWSDVTALKCVVEDVMNLGS